MRNLARIIPHSTPRVPPPKPGGNETQVTVIDEVDADKTITEDTVNVSTPVPTGDVGDMTASSDVFLLARPKKARKQKRAFYILS